MPGTGIGNQTLFFFQWALLVNGVLRNTDPRYGKRECETLLMSPRFLVTSVILAESPRTNKSCSLRYSKKTLSFKVFNVKESNPGLLSRAVRQTLPFARSGEIARFYPHIWWKQGNNHTRLYLWPSTRCSDLESRVPKFATFLQNPESSHFFPVKFSRQRQVGLT